MAAASAFAVEMDLAVVAAMNSQAVIAPMTAAPPAIARSWVSIASVNG